MNYEQTLAAIKKWQSAVRNVQNQLDALTGLLGCDYDSPFFTAQESLISEYTAVVAASVGDGDGWLKWFWLDCDLGAVPAKSVRPWAGAELREIVTLDDLARLIVDYAEHAKDMQNEHA